MDRAAAASLAAGAVPNVVEPDQLQQWEWGGQIPKPRAGLAAAPVCVFEDQNTNLPFRTGEFAWHLQDSFSQLASARAAAAQGAGGNVIRIAHLDTGYDPNHKALAGVKILRERTQLR
jgi:hypothetical protein